MLNLRTFSSRRYRVVGQLASPRSPDFHRLLEGRRFLPLTPHETSVYGWVDADNLLLTEFSEETVRFGSHAVFGLRIDSRRVNPRLLRARVDLEMRSRRLAARDAGRTAKLSREERRQIRADAEEELLAATNPAVRACTLVLESRRRQLLVLTRSRPVLEIAMRHFCETFSVELVPLTPWTLSSEVLADSPRADVVDGLARTDFAQAAPRRVRELFPEVAQ